MNFKDNNGAWSFTAFYSYNFVDNCFQWPLTDKILVTKM